MAVKKVIQVPFDKNGLQSYPMEYYPEFRLVDNYELAELTINSFYRGRSAGGLSLVDMISRSVIDHGKVSGKWTFCKRGENYGLKLV
jgi:hypothetical protein